MYAIQTGTKFIKPSSAYLSAYDIVVSASPKFVKTQQEALAHKKAIIEQIDRSIAAVATVAKEVAKIPKLEAQLAELQALPYKDVANKIPRVERQLHDARWYKTASSVASWKRDVARLQRIKAGNICVVKMQKTLVDA